ncbi:MULTISPECIES: hypothetical protein [unclassified Streptococcus]|uniref:hypothetical protein n=1 Tax=unclassified Streptococcus TaxID=2608887 RepID=UPI00359E4D44
MDRKKDSKSFFINLVGIFLYVVLSEVSLIFVFRNDILNGFYQPWKFYAIVIAIVLINLLTGHSLYKHYKKELEKTKKKLTDQ